MKNLLTLDQLPLKQTGRIHFLGLDIPMRRRLMELGFVYGRTLTPIYTNLHNSMRAYRLDEAIIALRQSDAAKIMVEKEETVWD